MWQEVPSTPADQLIAAMEIYRKSPAVVRDTVAATLLGFDTPASYDRLERLAIREGVASFEQSKLDDVNRNVDAVLQSLKRAGINVAGSKAPARS
jgi:hypothetical protein